MKSSATQKIVIMTKIFGKKHPFEQKNTQKKQNRNMKTRETSNYVVNKKRLNILRVIENESLFK